MKLPQCQHCPGPATAHRCRCDMDPAQSGDQQPRASPPNTADEPSVPSTSARKRWRRNRIACDSCHARRVRCDRAFPCSRCLRSEVRCEFTRELRKRGRTARSKRVGDAESKTPPNERAAGVANTTTTAAPRGADGNGKGSPTASHQSPGVTVESAPTVDERRQPEPNATDDWLSTTHFSSEYGLLGGSGWNEGPLPQIADIWNGVDFAGFNAATPVTSRAAPMAHTPGSSSTFAQSLKYPVLRPLMPYLEPTLPRRLVIDLLELYFTSAFSTHMHPVCHHIHCYVLRKASFLSCDAPRPSSPALVASMLWVAALDDRAFALSISPPQRKKICQFLCSLTMRLLRPLIHVSFKDQYDSTPHDVPVPPTMHHPFAGTGDDRGLIGPAGSLDDVITYIHVASIISASEQKAASMRWWHAAFTLARELKLNQEIEVLPNVDSHPDVSTPSHDDFLPGWGGVDTTGTWFDHSNPARPSLNCVCGPSHEQGIITEEHREERRRTWWLLYVMDRHLALCYNRPLALLDAESEDLLLPLDEGAWQAGNVHSNSPRPDGPQCPLSGEKNRRRVFPSFICHDHSVFGFFLPLMTITGELIDLNQARNHPMLGLRIHRKEAWDVHISAVLRQLEIYKSSLTTLVAATEPGVPLTAGPPNPVADNPQPALQPQAQPPVIDATYSWPTQTVTAYASYLVHVLHILLVGKWDPIALLEDKDFYTSSPAFASTISHALDATNSVNQILTFDPDISFIPYFFGIQLLQGSFLLLLIVERLQKEAGEGILNACEVMIRATESCVVTLNTEYQRNFRQVMRSAVAQARGRPVDHSEIRRRRKAVLALYRWTRKGTGLAL